MHVHWKRNATKPCSDCLLKYASVSLRSFGSAQPAVAPALDRFTLSIEGPGRVDAVCGPSYPDGERIMLLSKGGSSKNEKLFFAQAEDKVTGIWMGAAEDKLSMALEIGEIPSGTKNIVLDITFEFTPFKQLRGPARVGIDFKNVKGVFIDPNGCTGQKGMLDDEAPVVAGLKEPWVAPFSGKWISAVGQDLSYGGLSVDVHSNGQEICSSKAVYVEGHGADIQRYEGCSDLGEIKQGDNITIMPVYDPSVESVSGGLAGYVLTE
jgi:hypothetical protein